MAIIEKRENEKLNTVKTYDLYDRFIDGYDIDGDITDNNIISNIIRKAYEYNANIFITNRLAYTSFEMIRKITISDTIQINIY